jgi:uncharacterized protein
LSKFLLLILCIVAAFWLAKGFRRRDASKEAREAEPEQMVTCDHCGLNLPESEAIAGGDRYFCSAEHRRLAG